MAGSYVVGVRIPRAQLDELIAHAQEEAPYECCGYARIDDGRVEEVFRGQSARRSRWGFELARETMEAAMQLDGGGHGVAVYHSHPKSEAVPSQQDKNVANPMLEHWLNLIVSLEDEPHVRAWWLAADGRVTEEPLEVE